MSSSAREVFTIKGLVEISFNKFIAVLQHLLNNRHESHGYYPIADYWAKRDANGKASIKWFYTTLMTRAFEQDTAHMDHFGNLDHATVLDVMVKAMNDHRDRRSPPLTPPMPTMNLGGYRENEGWNAPSASTGGLIPGYIDM